MRPNFIVHGATRWHGLFVDGLWTKKRTIPWKEACLFAIHDNPLTFELCSTDEVICWSVSKNGQTTSKTSDLQSYAREVHDLQLQSFPSFVVGQTGLPLRDLRCSTDKRKKQNMKKEQREKIVPFAKEQFAFLKAEKGFTKPLINRPNYALLIYRNATMGIRIEMSIVTNDMEVLIWKLGSYGKFPLASQEHQRTLWLLESLLTRQFEIQDEHILALDQIRIDTLRIENAWDREREYEWGIRRWKQVIGLYRALLRDYIDLIVQHPFEVLFPSAVEYLAMGESRQEWEQVADAHFAFLEEYGFRPHPVYAVDSWLGVYTWMSADRGIQLTVDYRDMNLSCDVVSLIDGKIPATDKNVLKQHGDFIQGQGVEISLCDLLGKQLGITDPEIERVGKLDDVLNIRHWTDYDYRYVSTFIIEHANVVRRYIRMLIDTPLETLFASARLNYIFIDV